MAAQPDRTPLDDEDVDLQDLLDQMGESDDLPPDGFRDFLAQSVGDPDDLRAAWVAFRDYMTARATHLIEDAASSTADLVHTQFIAEQEDFDEDDREYVEIIATKAAESMFNTMWAMGLVDMESFLSITLPDDDTPGHLR